MKPIIQKLGLLVAMLLAILPMSAYDFEVDGFQYDIIDAADGTVKIVGGDSLNMSILELPNEVIYKNKTLKVKQLTAEIGEDVETLIIPSNIDYIKGGGSGYIHDDHDGCLFRKNFTKLIIKDSNNPLIMADALYSSWAHSSYVGALSETPVKHLYLGRELRSDSRKRSPLGRAPLNIVEIGPSCKVITQGLFEGITTFEEVEFVNGSNLQIIEEGAFRWTSIRTFDYTESIEQIGDFAFKDCENLKKINTFSDKLTKIGESAFSGTSISLVDISKSDKCTLAAKSFSECKSLKSVSLPEALQTIPEYCFYGCDSLRSINIPSELSKIGSRAFSGCKQIDNFRNPIDQYDIGSFIFSGSGIKKLKFKKAQINPEAINHCSALDSLVFSSKEGIEIMPYFFNDGEEGFDYSWSKINHQVSNITYWCMASIYDLNYLEFNSDVSFKWSVDTGDRDWYYNSPFRYFIDGTVKYIGSMTKIPSYFPYGNKNIIGEYIKNIGNNIFGTDNGVDWELTCYAKEPPSCSNSTFAEACFIEYKVRVPSGCIQSYKDHPIWGKFWDLDEFEASGITDTQDEMCPVKISVRDHAITISGKHPDVIAQVYNLDGVLVVETTEEVITNLSAGVYIVKVDGKTFKAII